MYDSLWQDSVEESLSLLEEILPEDVHLFAGFPVTPQGLAVLRQLLDTPSPGLLPGWYFNFL